MEKERFYLLDIARAVAAICVVLQHYQHFYFISGRNYPINFVRDQQPFYDLLKPFYLFGTVAVQFFFVLSGFIFFLMYSKSIYERKVNIKNFFILRISRLYPLHILTLISVMILQLFYFNLNGDYFVNNINDFKHFVYHFFLIQEWGFAEGWAFNHPSWSISVEILLYIIFFITVFIGINNLRKSLLALVISFTIFVLTLDYIEGISLGLVCFYIGGVTCFISSIIKKILLKNNLQKKIILIILLLLNIIVFGRFLNNFFLEYQKSLQFLIGENFYILLFLIKFPMIILNLSILQFYFKNLGKPFQLFGDLSYTIYLLHFVIQIIFSLIDKSLYEINFDSNYIFIIFFFTLFISSFFIYQYIELKMKLLIRKKFIR